MRRFTKRAERAKLAGHSLRRLPLPGATRPRICVRGPRATVICISRMMADRDPGAWVLLVSTSQQAGAWVAGVVQGKGTQKMTGPAGAA